MQVIKDKIDNQIAIVLSASDYILEKTKKFYSEPEDILQFGSLFFPAGSEAKPHLHKVKTIGEVMSNEVIFVLKGSVEATIYDNWKNIVKQLTLNVGDILLQKSGGHGFKFLCDTKIVEIKNGQYYGQESDKEMI